MTSSAVRKRAKTALRRLALVMLFTCVVPLAYAFEPFTVESIRVEGLQRVSVGSVLNALPVETGDEFDRERSAQAVRALYQTGFFRDVVLERENNALVVFVTERPAIASIEITGNNAIPTDALTETLTQQGLAEGRILNPPLLDALEQELQRQYLNLGKYSARVQTEVTPLERNRVDVLIQIQEGEAATIAQINLIGNASFDDQTLLRRFESGVRDQYTRPALAGDLEALRSFYLDRGFINFDIVSTQVSITPDRRQVYITINLSEGERYTVSSVSLLGDIVLSEAEINELIAIQAGDLYARREVTESTTRIADRLSEVGYSFANVNAVPEVDDEAHEVALTFFVDPGRRVYVRRIAISGNDQTRDEVIRREIRQMESAWFDTQKVNRSRTRINRLGFFESVNVETRPVPGEPDKVDLEFNVVERETFGSLNLGIGYGNEQGLLLNASISQENVFGSGKRFSVNVDHSDVNQIYSFNLVDPYYTLDGVSRGYRLMYRRTDAEQANLARFTTDTFNGRVTWGMPLSEFTRINYGLGLDATRINIGDNAASEIRDYIDTFGNQYNTVRGELGWTRDTRDARIFPTEGSLLDIGAELAYGLGHDGLSFYKAHYRHGVFYPLTRDNRYVLSVRGDVRYGDVIDENAALPPFERYYAGGIRTVRGYRANTLGPRDAETNEEIGGSFRTVGNVELILPLGFGEERSSSTRIALFYDIGNAFWRASDFDASELRQSAGVELQWLTPIGPMVFSWAQPLNAERDDRKENFQFSLGIPF